MKDIKKYVLYAMFSTLFVASCIISDVLAVNDVNNNYIMCDNTASIACADTSAVDEDKTVPTCDVQYETSSERVIENSVSVDPVEDILMEFEGEPEVAYLKEEQEEEEPEVKTNATIVQEDNDGSARQNPYGICEIPPSFEGLYYDCYIPYSLTCREVGGYSITMGNGDQNMVICTKLNWEDDYSLSYTRGFDYKYTGSYTRGYDDNTGATVYSGEDGTMFYMAALPYFCYNYEQAGSDGFAGWGLSNRGQVYDVILTDGTVLHFIVGDAKSNAHTNGSRSSSYDLTSLNYPQYAYLFQAYAGETIELFGHRGCVSKFAEYYNIGSGEDQNKVAYIRMYNLRLKDGEIIRAKGIPAGVGYSDEDLLVSETDKPAVPENNLNNVNTDRHLMPNVSFVSE